MHCACGTLQGSRLHLTAEPGSSRHRIKVWALAKTGTGAQGGAGDRGRKNQGGNNEGVRRQLVAAAAVAMEAAASGDGSWGEGTGADVAFHATESRAGVDGAFVDDDTLTSGQQRSAGEADMGSRSARRLGSRVNVDKEQDEMESDQIGELASSSVVRREQAEKGAGASSSSGGDVGQVAPEVRLVLFNKHELAGATVTLTLPGG